MAISEEAAATNEALKIDPTHCDSDGNSDSSTFNRTSFRELLLNAIEDLQGTDKREQKATLKKLLTSIQTCFKGQRENNSRHSLPAVKVYHFKHKDSEDEEEEKKDEEPNGENEEGEEETKMVTSVDLKAVLEKNKAREEILFGERRLNVMFKPIGRPKQNKPKPETASIGKIRLKLDEETMEEIDDYRRSFAEFTRNNIMYIRKNKTRPWELVGRMADHIIMDIIRDIASDFQNDSFLQSLYENELLEVIN
ncbi:hypothetical protein RUM44_007628 [Polyplax serrata]|uniref:Uncharacterized protein n=1 Tax=Polyplax serrata TaxID=468196 RepID=A0ABR1BA26_POLSC